MLYDEEPSTIQLGECVIVSCNFRISYLTDALSYNDTQIEISLMEMTLMMKNGEIVGETKYLTMPLTKILLMKDKVSLLHNNRIMKSQYLQNASEASARILANGFMNPFDGRESDRIDSRTGMCGMYDGVDLIPIQQS